VSVAGSTPGYGSASVPELVVASFNTHAGVDGWGRPYDLVAACRVIDADVLVLQESFAPEGGPSDAAAVAEHLGYRLLEAPLAPAARLGPHPEPTGGWGPVPRRSRIDRRLWVGASRKAVARHTGVAPSSIEPGTWGLAVLSRLPVLESRVVELGRLRRDFTRRAALVVVLDVEGLALTVVATHLAHFSHGSPLHFWRLRRELPGAGDLAVLAGDMNFWGPPVAAALPGWRRAARGPTWPADSPHSQLDHILVTRPVEVTASEVLDVGGSDHRPVRASIHLGV